MYRQDGMPQRADRRVGQVGQLDLHRGMARGERPLDLLELARAGHAAEPEPGDLVERRPVLGEAGHAARDRCHEARAARPAAVRGRAGRGHELGLGPLDPSRQRGVTEQGHGRPSLIVVALVHTWLHQTHIDHVPRGLGAWRVGPVGLMGHEGSAAGGCGVL
jgi:hypothetical protein